MIKYYKIWKPKSRQPETTTIHHMWNSIMVARNRSWTPENKVLEIHLASKHMMRKFLLLLTSTGTSVFQPKRPKIQPNHRYTYWKMLINLQTESVDWIQQTLCFTLLGFGTIFYFQSFSVLFSISACRQKKDERYIDSSQ